MEKYVIWHVTGGLGKNVAASSLCKDIKDKYPDRKFILVASYPEIFINNPYIDRVYNVVNTPYFFENYIQNKDTIIYAQEAYLQSDHITGKKHLIDNWCDLIGIEYKEQIPELHFNYAEYKSYAQKPHHKPLLFLHTSGGMVDDIAEYNWTRDIPIEFAQDIVKYYQNEYDILQITRTNGYKLEGVTVVNSELSNINLFALLANSQKRILIDSCLQHAAVAMNLPSTVLWIGTSPKTFGYNFHKNIVANKPNNKGHLIDSLLFDYQFSKNEHQCPYSDYTEIFNPNIINEL